MSNYKNIEEGYTYGRGAGYSSRSVCNRHSDNGCDKYGLLFYPKCRNGYKSSGCCICSNDDFIDKFKEYACPFAWKAFNLAGGCQYSKQATIAGITACMGEGGGPEDVIYDEPCIELVNEMSNLCSSQYELTQQIACQKYGSDSSTDYGNCPDYPNIKKTDETGSNCPSKPACVGTQYGCCDDKATIKIDQYGSNCPAPCTFSKYGCCSDKISIKFDDKGSNCPTTCLPKYSLCTGKNLKCCDDSTCRSKNDYYSQCCPNDKTSDECQSWGIDYKTPFSPNCTPKYGNCTNPLVSCCENSECRKKDEYYSQCCPKDRTGDECKSWNLR